MTQAKRVPLNHLGRLGRSDIESALRDYEAIVRSGVLLNGPYVRSLEERVSTHLMDKDSVCVSSGTDALVLALAALGITSESRVAVVGNAAGYSTNVVLRRQALPVLVDTNPESAQMSFDELKAVFESSTPPNAVIVTHLYGLTSEIDKITELCGQHGSYLIEDCAQSFGAIFAGVPVGAWGDAAAFSFYPTKNLAALGDGGMVAFKDSEACTRARKIAQYGWSSRYEVELSDGINSRLDEIQAAVVLHRLSSVDSRNSRRRDILRRYAEAVTMPRRFIFEDSERCVAHLAVMRTPTRDRDRTVLNSFGIETAIHYPIPDHKQPAWRHLFEGVALPNTEAHCAEVLTLPCFPELTEEEIVRVCEALRSL